MPAEAAGAVDPIPVATELVGTSTDWERFLCEPSRVALFAEVARLDPADYRPGAELPPTYLVAQHVDTFALRIPDAPIRLNGGNWCRLGEATHVGEELERSTRVADVVRKQGRSGVLVMYELETTCRRPNGGAVVATFGHTTIRRYPTAADAGTGAGAGAGAGASSADRPDGGAAGADTNGSVATLEIVPSSRDLVRYAATTGDFYEAHYDQAFAQARGFAGVIVHGLLKLTWLATAALHHAGPGYRVREVSASYRGVDVVGRPFAVWCGAPTEGSGEDLQVSLRGVSADGVPTTLGEATLAR